MASQRSTVARGAGVPPMGSDQRPNNRPRAPGSITYSPVYRGANGPAPGQPAAGNYDYSSTRLGAAQEPGGTAGGAGRRDAAPPARPLDSHNATRKGKVAGGGKPAPASRIMGGRSGPVSNRPAASKIAVPASRARRDYDWSGVRQL